MSTARRSRSRHGRTPRSDVRGIAAPDRGGRNVFFVDVAREVINYLCDVQPERMAGVRVDMGLLPSGELADGQPRLWSAIRAEKRVVVYRIPIERMTKLHRDDPWHRRNNIETVIIDAIADLLDIDPFEFAPNRYFPHA